jgi:hypothetical protein
MPRLDTLVEKVRSKNAGPFWITVDIFCGTTEAFWQVQSGLESARVAALFQTSPSALRRFDIKALNVVKFSLPRPNVQGTIRDRDMHGAGYAALLAELEI